MSFLISVFKKTASFWQRLIFPKNINSNRGRRELILNILLLLSIVVFSLINIIRLIDVWNNSQDRGLPIIYTLVILLFFIVLRWLSWRGWTRLASWLFISAYALPMLYSFITWGADLPAALLLGVLFITFLGILISTPAALCGAIILNIFLIFLTSLQSKEIIQVAGYWRAEKHEIGDAIVYAILLLLITSLVWVFEREIRRALRRAEKSELALMAEKDILEEKVIERTKLIREMEAEKIGQLYRLAEFGRLSSGIFHDLINPLTAISLNLEQINNSGEPKINSAKDSLTQAIAASRKMEDLIACIKRSIRKENRKERFSLNNEIETIIKILSYKTRIAKAKIIFQAKNNIYYFGDSAKFGQVIANLISNSIEAGVEFNKSLDRAIEVNVKIFINKESKVINISVKDNCGGITTSNFEKIFEPFFSTKPGCGFGIGLSSAKNIIEKDFSGKIKVKSESGKGSEFIILLPLKHGI